MASMARLRRAAALNSLAVGCLVAVACNADPSLRKQQYLESGNKYLADGKYASAIIEYRNAVDIDPKFGEARKQLAEAYARSDDARRAFEEYIYAADLLPSDVQVQLTAGAYSLALHKAEHALARAEKALKVEPNNIQAHLLRGNALAGLSSFDDALKAMEEAIRLDPARGITFTQLGLVEFARGRRAEAEAAFTKAVDLAPKSVETHLALELLLVARKSSRDREGLPRCAGRRLEEQHRESSDGRVLDCDRQESRRGTIPGAPC